MRSGPCAPWVTPDELREWQPLATDPPYTDEVLERWIDVSSENLFQLTARRYAGVVVEGSPGVEIGACEGTFRPLLCGHRRRRCSCGSGVDSISLGVFPIRTAEVTVDGVALVEGTDFRIEREKFLVRIDGKLWPTRQRLDLPSTEDGTFEVVVSWGAAPPQGGKYAVSVWAFELAKAALGEECQLPERVVSVVREGLTMTVLDSADYLDKGRTGIAEVDQWISVVNPAGHRRKPRFVRLDKLPRARRLA